MRIIYRTNAQDHTNSLFINLNVMKFLDDIEYKTAIIMYKVKYNLHPKNNLKLFHSRDKCFHVTKQRKCLTNVCSYSTEEYVYDYNWSQTVE